MAKQVVFDQVSSYKLAEGIRKIAGAVKVTLGPSGRNVILEKKFGSPQATKDGVTVSKEVELEDPFENCGAKLANEAADKTNDTAGDGTTTAIVLVESIYNEGLKYIAAGYNPVGIKRGIDRAVSYVVEEIKKLSRPVAGINDSRNIALVSSHYDQDIADKVSKAINKCGKEGVITVEESKGFETILEEVDGLQFDKGFISPYFMNKADTLTAEYEQVYILLTEKKISAINDIVPILEKIAATGRPPLIIAEEVEGEALAALVINKLRGILPCVAVKAPAFGDRRKAILQDIAVLTGGRVISEDVGLTLENLTLKDLGRAKKVTVDKDNTTIMGGSGDKKAIDARVAEIRKLIEKTTSDYDKEKYQERLAKLLGGVCIIKVGASTEAEMKEKKFRVEDAVHATKAAAEEGIIIGAGVAYLRARSALKNLQKELTEDEFAGVKVIEKALESPLYNIARNAGFDSSVVVEEVCSLDTNIGFDAITGNYVDMFKAGIVDPAKVARLALQNAASVASMALTSKALITELKEKQEAVKEAVK